MAEVDEIRWAGECALVVMHISGTARASGLPLSQDVVQIITWYDCKMWRFVAHNNLAEALEAVGLAE